MENAISEEFDLMVRTIPQGDLDINDGIAGKNTGLHRALDTIVNSGDIFLRDSAANDTLTNS